MWGSSWGSTGDTTCGPCADSSAFWSFLGCVLLTVLFSVSAVVDTRRISL